MIAFGRSPGQTDRRKDDDYHRRYGENRDRLRSDHPRHQALVEARHMDDRRGKRDAEKRAEGEAEQRRGKRHPAVIDEAPLRIRRGLDDRLVEFLADLVWRREHRALLRPGRFDERGKGRVDIGPPVEFALERRIQKPRCHVPDDDDGDDDDRNGDKPALQKAGDDAGTTRNAHAGDGCGGGHAGAPAFDILPREAGEGDHRKAMVEGAADGGRRCRPLRRRFAAPPPPLRRGGEGKLNPHSCAPP